MNKIYLLFLLSLFTFLSWGQTQTLKNNFVVGAELPFLYNNDREKPDTNSSSNVSFSFRPRINVFLQADRYKIVEEDFLRVRKLSLFSARVDYTFLQTQQNDDYSRYNHIHQVSFLYIIGGMHKEYGTQVGIGPNLNFGDAKGVNARLFLSGYGEWKGFIGSVDINFYLPHAKRKEGVPSDSYKYGHIAIGLAYRL